MKNIVPLLFIFLMLLILAYAMLMHGGPAEFSPPPPQKSQEAACTDGLTQYCRVGNCSGTSTCVGGIWGGCKWERVCVPGSKATCLKSSCPYALKECNECGTGYGPCLAAEPG